MMVLLEYIVVGLAGGAILIFLAKGIMGPLLQRHLDYYDEQFDQGGEQDA